MMRAWNGLKRVRGSLSWPCSFGNISLAVTRQGGFLNGLCFTLGQKKIEPLSIAPWSESWRERRKIDDRLLRELRGDFFCLPFGGDPKDTFNGESHPSHGEPAHGIWEKGKDTFEKEMHRYCFTFRTKVRPGILRKEITLRRNQTVVYQKHFIGEIEGWMNYGHHTMVSLDNGDGVYSSSEFKIGQVWPRDFELPVSGGYTSLKAGAFFESLSSVPQKDGEVADLRFHPCCEGFENLVILAGNLGKPFAWNAMVFPSAGFLWFSLKDPTTLPSTVLWLSNGGRHYSPWDGRHRRVLGVEDVLGYFSGGLRESVDNNSLNSQGVPTAILLKKDEHLLIAHIIGVASVPDGFDRVKDILPSGPGKIRLISESGKDFFWEVDHDFLFSREYEGHN